MKSSPTILHILHAAHRGGCERDCWCLCENWRDAHHHVLILEGEGPMSADLAATGATVEHLDVMQVSNRDRIETLRARVAAIHPQSVIVWHGMPQLPQILHALSNWQGTVFVHGGNPARRDLLLDARFLLLERIFPSPHRPVYVCCSHYVERSFVYSYYLRRFRTEVVFNGVESPGERIHQPRPLLANGPATVGMMARLDRSKDFTTALQALAWARHEGGMDMHLELAGDGPDRLRLEGLTRKLGLDSAVHFLGSVTDVYGTMAGWDLFIYATSVAEGFGNVLAEAMSFGLPTVVTDVGPMREVGGEDGAVCYVPPASPAAMARAALALLRDETSRQIMSEEARQRALADFSGEIFARHYRELMTGVRYRKELAA